MEYGNGRHENNIGKFILVFVAVCLLIGVTAGGITLWQIHQENKAQQEMEQLAEKTYEPQESARPTPQPTMEPEAEEEEQPEGYPTPADLGIEVPDKELHFTELRETNSDIYAWICIPDTKIDYPILQSEEELDYYLQTNLDGSKGYPGCIYTQMMNSKDWSDRNTVIYGHNMGNGTMFQNLHYYEDSEFFESHPYVYIYTEQELLVYRVFAAYENDDRHVLLYNDFSTPESFEEYIDKVYEKDGLSDHLDEDARPGAEDRIITLSTCINKKPNRRWLVQAVLAAREPYAPEAQQ